MAENYRNVGLGIMGLHDALIKLGMTYGSKESIDFTDSVMNTMFRSAVIGSSALAKEKGRFPMYKDELLDSEIIKNHFSDHELESFGIRENGLRNCSLLSIAPTGSLGTMLNISTGCEPLFALYYNRKTESLNGGEEKYYKVYSGVVKDYVEAYGETLPEYFVSSGDIKWKDRVDMQAVLQNHVDTAISSTINLPNSATLDEIEELYLYSWESGLKGVTIFRDGCKRAGILSTGNSSDEPSNSEVLKRGDIIACSDDLIGRKRKLMSGCGSLHVLAYFDKSGNMQEVYLNMGSGGGCLSNTNALSRMISLLLRAGVDIYSIKDQLDSVFACPAYAARTATKHDTSRGRSCPSAVGHAIVDMWEEMQRELGKEVARANGKKKVAKKPELKKHDESLECGRCPECGEKLQHVGGCVQCSCGYSKCG